MTACSNCVKTPRYIRTSLTAWAGVGICLSEILQGIWVPFPRRTSKTGSFPNGKTHHRLGQQLRAMELAWRNWMLFPGWFQVWDLQKPGWAIYMWVSISSRIFVQKFDFTAHSERCLFSTLCTDPVVFVDIPWTQIKSVCWAEQWGWCVKGQRGSSVPLSNTSNRDCHH